jgi:sodium/bile acid cotransporter 7
MLSFFEMKPSEDEQLAKRPQSRPGARALGSRWGTWLKTNGFILGLFGVVLLAFIFPEPAASNGWLHPALVQNIGIALILLLQGISMPLEKVAFGMILQKIWPGEPPTVRDGFLYLCVLPSTVSTSVVLTSVAGGNTAAAILSAAFSNIVGVILTPLLVSLLIHATGKTGSGSLGPLLLDITMLTLLPFALGAGLRPFVRHWVDANKKWVNRISNSVILFFVYSAFCDSVKERIWHEYGLLLTVQILLCVAALFGIVSLLIYLATHLARLNREDTIACYFCSVKKTLAMGVPLAILIFGARTDLSLILLPMMFYHPFQLFTNGILANHWAKQRGHRVGLVKSSL